MTFFITDNVFGLSGYAKATRELAYAMSKFIDVKIVDNGARGYIPERILPLIIGGMPKMSEEDFILGRLYFSKLVEAQVPARKIGTFVLESTKLPERLVSEANNDGIWQNWVPSMHCAYHAADSGVIVDKIQVIPHGYDPEIFYYKKTKEDGPYTFLFVGGYTGKGDRKGLDLLWKAFHQEFSSKDDVRLVIKLNKVYDPKFNVIRDLTGICEPKKELMVFNDAELTDSQMADVYRQSSCFVCPSAAEGFNMTVLEAMACGLPVITGEFGGHMDYINNLSSNRNRVALLHGTIVPARYSPWDCGDWVYPNIMELRISLRAFYENRIPKGKYKNIEKWTWEEAAKKAVAALCV